MRPERFRSLCTLLGIEARVGAGWRGRRDEDRETGRAPAVRARSRNDPRRLRDAPRTGKERHGRRAQVQREVRRVEPGEFRARPRRRSGGDRPASSRRLSRTPRYCQGNVRRFAVRKWPTLLPLEVEIRPGVVLGHRHIPVNSVGSYIPGGRYPMFGSAQMSIIPAQVAGVKTVDRLHAAGERRGLFPGDHQRHPCCRC